MARTRYLENEMNYLFIDAVTKSFGDFKALDQASLRVRENSIHAILGENGAGKTTLMNVLYGLYQPDAGRIVIQGRDTRIENPRHAIENNIGMIHQHLMLVKSLTVTENIILGLKGRKTSLNLAHHEQRIRKLGGSLGIDIDPKQNIRELSMGLQQQVEILKVLYRDAKLLILDEPTEILAPDEIEAFLAGLKRLRNAGHTILFITHKLEEVMAVADRVTVLQRGRTTAEAEVKDTTVNELAHMMVGRDVLFEFERHPRDAGAAALVLENVCTEREKGLRALDNASFSLHEGEILGVAGVDGNGQSELAEVIAGLRPLARGSITVGRDNITRLSPRVRKQNYGIGYIPEDRHGTGLVLDYPVVSNVMLRDFGQPPFARGGFIDAAYIRNYTAHIVEKYDVRLDSIQQLTRFLSGGNQQKLILGRELEADPKILIAMQPTKGLDVGAIEFVQKMILRQRDAGKAILYISTELEHLMAVADRVAVMFRGRITGMLKPADATAEKLGLLMSGVREER